MKEAKISEIKNQLSRYLALVRNHGEVVRILDRNVPVAQLVPITTGASGRSVGSEALLALERKGLIRRGTGVLDREILETDPPEKPAGVLRALLEERDGRGGSGIHRRLFPSSAAKSRVLDAAHGYELTRSL